MRQREKWHKITSVVLATALLLTMLTVPTASAGEEEMSVVSTEIQGSEINDTETENTNTDTIEQETTEQNTAEQGITEQNTTGQETTETREKEEVSAAEEPAQSSEEDSLDTQKTKQSDTKKSDKQEQFALKGNVTLEDLTGKNLLWKDVLVRLYDADTYNEKEENHTYLAETLTKKDGAYTFEAVQPGNYRIEFVNRNNQYDHINCKWKKPESGEKKIYTVEMTRQKVGLEEDSEESNQGDQEECFAFIKKLALPQKSLLRTEKDNTDTYIEVNLDFVEIEEGEEIEKDEKFAEEAQSETKDTEDDDYSDLMSIEELKDIDGDMAAATMEKRDTSDIMPMSLNGATWFFDAYYLKENDRYHITKTEKFTLKYQMEFHTSNEDIESNTVEIRVQRTLLSYHWNRSSNGTVTPSEIGVPQGTPDNYKESPLTPFNYYVEGDELVFFNYKMIPAGTSAAFQILYKDVDVMYIQDMSTWTLTPQISVKDSEPMINTPSLTGLIDTGISLTSVTKSPYHEEQLSYTPGLYKKDQVRYYIGKDLPEKYKDNNFNKYKYVLWQVEINGTATQPWNIEVKESPDHNGEVVGYRTADITTAKGSRILGEALSPESLDDGYVCLTWDWDRKKRESDKIQHCVDSDNYSFYVVVAYPNNEVVQDTVLNNTIDVRLRPIDNDDDIVEKTVTAKWAYVDYSWEYQGDNYQLKKDAVSNGSYGGWLEIYRELFQNGGDMEAPAIDFHIASKGHGFGYTHDLDLSSPKFGQLIENHSYSMAAVDDIVYAFSESSNQYKILDGTDYYFSSVNIKMTDQGYDVYEDDYAAPDEAGDLEIYAIFAKDEAGNINTTNVEADNWEKVAAMPWHESGMMSYFFSKTNLAREPWRVKAVHNTTNYQIEYEIDVSVTLRKDSPNLAALFQDNPDMEYLTIKNLAGLIVENIENYGKGNEKREWIYNTVDGDKEYGEPGLENLTKSIYGNLMQRNTADVELHGLEKDAGAYKTSSTFNDPNNSRTQVEFQLRAYDGYIVQSQEMVNDLKTVKVATPGRKDVVFYDLLPYGMHYDPFFTVQAYRIKRLDENSKPDQIDTDLITVDIKNIENYRNTGRAMVIFNIHYEGGDSAFYCENKNEEFKRWYEHWGIRFRAYYSWKDVSVVKAGTNIFAFMPKKDDNRELLGKEGQVSRDNGLIEPNSLQNLYKDFGPDIDEDGNTEERTVLYASTKAYDDDIAIATKKQIEKLVRADSDQYDEYRKNTVVAPGEGYTYDITVSSEGADKNIVVFDRLEYESDEMAESNPESAGNYWQGTFDSVITSGLELLEIAPVVYYNKNRNAKIPEGTETPSYVLTEENGWYNAATWKNKGYKTADVKAVAIDLSKTIYNQDYILNNHESVTFQIKMRAPESGVENGSYTYNRPDYYSETSNSDIAGTLSGNLTTVKLYGMEEVEVVKEFSGDIPDAVANTSFWFNVTQQEGDQIAKFASQEYQLWKKDDSGEWVRQGEGTIYGTDAEGNFSLHGGEKAVFQIADADRISVEEEENPNWKSNKKAPTERIEGNGDEKYRIRSFTFINAYHPVLCVQKTVNKSSIPRGLKLSEEEFTFQIFADGKPVANAEYWYLDSIIADYHIPQKVKELGENGIGYTDNNGKFTMKEGQIIGLFPGKEGTAYMVQEILETGNGSKWICEDKNPISGTLSLKGEAISFNNICTRKELYVTKKVTHYDDSTEEFKFQILDVTDNQESRPVSDNNRWVIVDSHKNETDTFGYLEDDGTFYCSAGQTVKICDLQANHTYIVKEIDISEDYMPEQAVQEVTMPLYNADSNLTFINDYRWRSLTVSKQVVYPVNPYSNQQAEIDAIDFTMTAELIKSGSLTAQTLSDTDFVRILKDGKTEEDKTDADGTFKIKNGESVFFKDVGMRGDTIIVTETQDESYPQVYPAEAAPYREILGAEDCEMNFINGTKGNLVIMNNIVAGDDGGQELIDAFKVYNMYGPPPSYYLEYSAAPTFQFNLTMQAASEEYPGWDGSHVTGGDTSFVSLSRYWSSPRSWSSSILQAKPGDILFPVPSGPPDAVAVSYSISMEKESQNFIWCWKNALGGRRWFEFTLQEPEYGKTITGTLEDNPVVTFVTEVKEISYTGSKIEKRMAPASNDVPDGARLVWRLERYNGSSWKPEAGISYAVLDAYGRPDADGIQVTGEDGKILLSKNPGSNPAVQFLEDTVYLNRNDEAAVGDLRLIELMEESDKSWGRLAGYGDKNQEYSLFMPSEDAVAFVNANRNVPVQIAKEMSTASQENFTMYLKQVVSTTSKDTIGSEEDIRETIPGAGIQYILYDSRTNRETGRGVTGAKGEILVKAGEHATLYLPDKTVWTVEEEIKANYELKDLNGTPEGAVTPLGDNLMLIYPKAEETRLGMIKAKFKPCYVVYQGLNYPYQNNVNDVFYPTNYEVVLCNSDGEEIKTLTPGMEYLVDTSSTQMPIDYSGWAQITIYGVNAKPYGSEDYTGLTTQVSIPVVRATTTISGESDLANNHLEIDGEGNLYIPYIVKGYDNNLTAVAAVSMYSDKVKNLVLEEGIMGLGSFSGCSNLESIVIPASAKSNYRTPSGGSYDLYLGGCAKLKNVVIKEGGLTSIQSRAFENCSLLKEITIPGSIESLGSYAFRSSGLEKIIFSEGVETIGSGIFESCKDLKEVILPDHSLKSIGRSAFYGCYNFKEIEIPGSVQLIEDYAFGWSGIERVTLRDGIPIINAYAFYRAENLKEINIPDSVQSIEQYAFDYCTSLTSIEIPGSVKSIGENAFFMCTSLKNLTLNDGIQNVKDYAFQSCSSLESVTIPSSVRFTGNYIFSGCKSLTDIYIDQPEGALNTNNWGLSADIRIHWRGQY